ncbi:signal peptidase I [Eubacterium barkeri]|uniref:Signal peptidase I n=1 Tax=Eubacterium barkeri TaxID=1528 RepID=A0A1H3GM82_EUBBA|nr:signal peptidase I [Eubacterium barkeri]SDY04095.1 signal peptidase, endoplasmic reticulum-type [Eubacterium barkeri]
MRKAYNILTTIILILLVGLAAIMMLPRLLGMTPLAVLSGSMEPTYHVGSLIFVKEADANAVKPGDPITFKISADTMVTHRVIAIDTQNQCFYTKGDANNTPDGGSVSYENLVGKPAFTVPMLGYLAVYAQTQQGMIILITTILVVLVLTFVPDLLFKEETPEKGKEKKNAAVHKKSKK